MVKTLRNIIILAVSLTLALSIVLVTTYSALTASKTATGTVTFTENYKLSVTKTNDTALESSDVTIVKNYFNGSASANIALSATNETATSLNNGSIEGDFKKYTWSMNGLNYPTENIVFKVNAQSTYEFYPKVEITLKYAKATQGMKDVHLSFNTEQKNIYAMKVDDTIYYSYIVLLENAKYLVTYPQDSQTSGTNYERTVVIVPLDANGQAQSVVGKGLGTECFKFDLTDIVEGVYLESGYVGSASMTVKFSLNQDLVI